MKNSKKSKLVYGVGINDAGYPVNISSTISGDHKHLWRCPMYQALAEQVGKYGIDWAGVNMVYILDIFAWREKFC